MTVTLGAWLADWREDRLGTAQWMAAALLLAAAATSYCLLSGLANGVAARPSLSVVWGAMMVLVPVATCAVLRSWRRQPSASRWSKATGCAVIVAGGVAMLVCGEKLLALLYWGRPWGDFFGHFTIRSPMGLLMFAVVALPGWLRPHPRSRLSAAPASASTCVILTVPTRIGEQLVVADQVLRAKAAGNYVELHTACECHLIRTTLSALADRLSGSGFVRVHRSALVNRRHVSRFDRDPKGEWRLRMVDGTVVRVGRRYRTAVETMIHLQDDAPASRMH